MSMKLVIAIVQNEDNQKLNNALVKEGFRSTRLATSGGFLRTGNTTVMIGVEESKLEEVLGIIESVCKARKPNRCPRWRRRWIPPGFTFPIPSRSRWAGPRCLSRCRAV